MSDSDGDMQLNISTAQVHKRPKKPQISKRQRLQQKRQERRIDRERDVKPPQVERDEDAEELEEPKSQKIQSPESSKPAKGKRKLDRKEDNSKDEKYSKKMKVSSIFTKNPEIPNIASTSVTPLQEAVFSDKTFGMMGLHPFMVSNLEQKFELKTVTTVQQMTIPRVLEGKDVLVKSQTGSGKTLSYAIPIVQMLQQASPKVNRTDGVYAVVLVPTRELALQSYNAFEKLLRPFTWIVPGVTMGGEKRKSEKARLRKGINVLVSTPGRLLDHFQNTNSLDAKHIKWLVIDEADRLLDMGFDKEVSKILATLDEKPTSRQTILLSATLSDAVESLAGVTLNNPVKIDISNAQVQKTDEESKSQPDESTSTKPTAKTPTEESFATPDSLKHHYVIVPSKLRLVTLASFILWKCKYSEKPTKMIVFLATQDSVEFHYQLLDQTINVDAEDEEDNRIVDFFQLHGEMPQKERTKVYKEFMGAPAGVMFCTDVAARGLDLPNVRWIVQYNTPGNPTDYIHRVGRTARIGAKGNGLLFLTPQETKYLDVLNEYKIQLGKIEVDNILKTLQLHVQDMPNTDKFSKQGPSTIQECGTALQAQLEDYVAENKDIRTLARKAYQSFIRAYTTYPSNLKYIFHIKSLHIGHTATSFGLQEAPKRIGNIVGNTISVDKSKRKKSKERIPGPKYLERKMKRDMASEFSSGLDATTTQKTRYSSKLKFK